MTRHRKIHRVECVVKGEKYVNVKKLAQREYKTRHGKVANLVYWKLCEKHNLERKEKWYKHFPEDVAEDDDVKFISNKYPM